VNKGNKGDQAMEAGFIFEKTCFEVKEKIPHILKVATKVPMSPSSPRVIIRSITLLPELR